ncbi:hypothetical protein D6783_00395 [Candidatus Woesearchaeota archaeon]|nr:MAG: hypothetical protein D6783_00395 [Candidatus Woesearchaeota archaeon]
MFLEIVLAVLLGLLAGTITGLVPGVHVNLVTALVMGGSSVLSSRLSSFALASFLVSMGMVHTFLDAIPSVFLGAPEDAYALGVLPGHRYVLRGQGVMAVKLTVLGSLLSLVGVAVLSPVLFVVFPVLAGLVKGVVGWVLLGVVVFMLARERRRVWGVVVFGLSSLLGVVVFASGVRDPLFPMLSGLFGVSTLVYSLFQRESFPDQAVRSDMVVRWGVVVQACVLAVVAGSLTALLPGVGAATAAVLALQLSRGLGDHGFMVLVGGISTVNFGASLITLATIGRARNGVVVGVQSLLGRVGFADVFVLGVVGVVAGGVGVVLALFLAKRFVVLLRRVPYSWLAGGVVGFLVVLSAVLGGFRGLLVLVTAAGTGLIPAVTRTARVHAMGCIMTPVMLSLLF